MLDDERHRPLPIGVYGLTIVRALTQWAFDFAADGNDGGFSFESPMLNLYRRCHRALRATESLLVHTSDEKIVDRSLISLQAILAVIRNQVSQFAAVARIVASRAELFDELRDAIRITPKEAQSDALADEQQKVKYLRDVEMSLKDLETSLRKSRPELGPGEEMRKAIDIILEHIDRHRLHLWGHLLSNEDGTKRVVARTNVILEQFFGRDKRGERRRSGRKNLTYDLEQLPAESFLAKNLENKDYLEIICDGSLANLPRAFADLDVNNRSQALPVHRQSMEQSAIVSSSLPKSDRKLVRMPKWQERVSVESKSRAPLRRTARRGGIQPQNDA